MESTRQTLTADVLIVGSGPVGATFARVIADACPAARLLMVDAGPQLTERPALHVKNITDPAERTAAQVASQGPDAYTYEIPTIWERSSAQGKRGRERVAMLARAGTHLVSNTDEELDQSGMPAAALSTNVGGMGAHWTGACPPPGNTERVPFIPEDEWEQLFERASQLLQVTTQAYPPSLEASAILSALGEAFNAELPAHRPVQPMPLAVQLPAPGQRQWVSADTVLGPLLDSPAQFNFALRSETVCQQLVHDGGQVKAALLLHRPSGEVLEVRAQHYVVAADALRTPQLLWASGIRPRALGHYLNDQPQVMAGAALSEEVLERTRAALLAQGGLPSGPRDQTESIIGNFWVPFHDPAHPFHGQVMHLDLSPIPLDVTQSREAARHIVGLGWFCRKELRFEDHIEFLEGETDFCGLPRMRIHYALTGRDQAEIAAARREQARAVAALGRALDEDESRMIPPGSSLHYQGTTRMGEQDDGQSVCDSYSRVWNFGNLSVGGNGVIPTATACNPTATSVALAIRAAESITRQLQASSGA